MLDQPNLEPNVWEIIPPKPEKPEILKTIREIVAVIYRLIHKEPQQ